MRGDVVDTSQLLPNFLQFRSAAGGSVIIIFIFLFELVTKMQSRFNRLKDQTEGIEQKLQGSHSQANVPYNIIQARNSQAQ